MKTPQIKKSSVLTILSVLIVVAILAFGIVKLEQHNKAVNVAKAQDVKNQQAVQQKQVDALKTANTTAQVEHAKRMGACSYINSLVTAKSTKGIVTLPVVYCQP